MLKAVNYWSFPGGLENTAPYPEVFGKAKDAGFEAVEVALGETGELTPSSDEKTCAAVRKAADDAGVGIAGVATGVFWEHSLSSSDEAERKRAVEALKGTLKVARVLGTDAVLVIPGAVDVFFKPDFEPQPYDQVWELSTESIKACLRLAEQLKVRMCVENVWNKFLLSPVEMKMYVDQFESRFVGVYLDVGNVIPFGYPEHWIKVLGERIGRVHVKDLKWRFVEPKDLAGLEAFADGVYGAGVAAFCDVGSGDVNWPAVIKALEAVGYDGPLSAEVPAAPGVLERTSAAMDRILGR